MTGNLGRFLAAVLLIAAAPASLRAEEPAQGIDPSLVIEQFDVFNDGDLLLVPVTAFGKTRMFAVDTGSSRMNYDKSLRPFLGKPLRNSTVPTLNGKVDVEVFESPRTRLGRISLYTSQEVGCFDFRELQRFDGHCSEGVVGMAALRDHIMHIDFDAGKLSFLKQAPEDAGERFQLFPWHGIPAIEAEINRFGAERFLIDTGLISNNAGDLNGDVAAVLKQEKLAEASDSPDTKAFDLSGPVELKSLRIKGLRLGSHRMFDVPISEGMGNSPSVLGLGFLTRFIVTFDFPNRAIYLKKSKHFDRPYRSLSGGVIFARDDAGVVVEAVREDGPAAKAGIKIKDVVLKVGEQETSGARLFKLYDEFRSPGQTVRVKLKRGDEIIETDVKLPEEDDKGSAGKPQDAGS